MISANRFVTTWLLPSLIVAVIAGGCGEGDDTPSWIIPADISGTWTADVSDVFEEMDEDLMAPVLWKFTFTQRGSQVTGTHTTVYRNGRSSRSPINGATYDMTTGLLIVIWNNRLITENFRFASETEMYSIVMGGSREIVGRLYRKE